MQIKKSIKMKSPEDVLKITILVYNSLKIIINTSFKQLENKSSVCQLCRF